jgi:cellobiose-specific phosphotransferase system component IIB
VQACIVCAQIAKRHINIVIRKMKIRKINPCYKIAKDLILLGLHSRYQLDTLSADLPDNIHMLIIDEEQYITTHILNKNDQFIVKKLPNINFAILRTVNIV